MADEYHALPDGVLVSLTLMDKQEAYSELVRRYQKLVLYCAWRYLHSQSLAEDAAQDAFVSGWMKLATLRQPERFGSWICRIATNHAKNMAKRYPEVAMKVDDGDTLLSLAERQDYYHWQQQQAEEAMSDTLRDALDRMSEKVRTIIELHYFEGLSVSEIAVRLSIPQGTVKYRLYQGREMLRKEYRKDDKDMEKFVHEVMEKVEALQMWGYKENKPGFAEAYHSVLNDVEKIPEDDYEAEKNSALADVLQMGFWWLPDGEIVDRDAHIARIRECLTKCHNEDVMQFLISHDHDKYAGKERLDFMRNTQIPQLEAAGYVQALAYTWFWLGCYSADEGLFDVEKECYQKVLDILQPSDVYYANALSALQCVEKRQTTTGRWTFWTTGEQYCYVHGKLLFDRQPGFNRGNLTVPELTHPMYYVSRCDNQFPDATLAVGESRTSDSGKVTMTHECDHCTVETPAGTFTDCQKWTVTGDKWGLPVVGYWKVGVGLVRYERPELNNVALALSEYSVTGDGLFPLVTGNRWKYVLTGFDPYLEMFDEYAITYADDEKAVLSNVVIGERSGYADTWQGQMLEVRETYVASEGEREWLAKDVRPILAHAATLATTPYEKVSTELAQEIMEEIWTTDPESNPGCSWKGHWNFFSPFYLSEVDNSWKLTDHPYHFEWKDDPSVYAPMLFTWIWDILSDVAGQLWSDKWVDGYSDVIEHRSVRTEIHVEEIDAVTVQGQTYEKVRRVHLNATGLKGGLGYRGGKMYYDFAPGMGIVALEHFYMDHENEVSARFELVDYAGTGDGYCPIAEGMRRKYALANCPDEIRASTTYAIDRDGEGKLICIAAQIGSKKRTEEEIAKDVK